MDIRALNERAKELRCLYAIDAIIADRGQTPASVFHRVLEAIPAGWQHPESTGATIIYLGRRYVGSNYASDGEHLQEPISLWGTDVGTITVSDKRDAAVRNHQPFLPEESELLHRIAARLGEYLEWKHTELLAERTPSTRNHWAWRQRFAEALADALDPTRFGIAQVFIGGSTARGDAGPASDVDLYVRFHGSTEQKSELRAWLEGWSLCMAQVALQQTGQPFPGGMLNVQWLDGEPSPWQKSELLELKMGPQPNRAQHPV